MSNLKVIQQAIQEAINTAITSPDYKPALPILGDEVWNTVFDWQNHYFSNNCLEWLGDGLMYAAISVELYRQVPKGNPHMYTMIRSPIVTNQTFALLTNKMNISDSLIHASASKARSSTDKCYADLFEVIPAEVYLRGGFDVLRQWVAKVFEPLIKAAVAAYHNLPFHLNRKRKRVEEFDPPTLTGMASFRATKRQKAGQINSGSIVDDAQRLCASSELKVTSDTSFGSSSRIVEPTHLGQGGADRERSSLPQVRVPNSMPIAVRPNRARDASVASGSASSKLSSASAIFPPYIGIGVKKRVRTPTALSELSTNTASSSREPTQSGGGYASYRPKPSATHGSLFTAHSAAWERALKRPSEPGPSGLQAVLSSPSRYIAASPSAPACGPGSSWFDPIVIDDGDDDDDDDDDGADLDNPPREVIELSDDDDYPQAAGSDEEEVEILLVPTNPARTAKPSLKGKATA